MERVAVDTLAPDDLDGTLRRDLAVNHCDVPPAGRLPGGLHAYADQEELFVVVEGTATFETYRDGTGEAVTVAAGEPVRFAPGESARSQRRRRVAGRPRARGARGDHGRSASTRLPRL